MSNRSQQLPVVLQLNRSSDLFVLSRHQLILLSSEQMKTINQRMYDASAWNCSSSDYLSEKYFHLQRTPTLIACFQCCQFCKGQVTIFFFSFSQTLFKLLLRKENVLERVCIYTGTWGIMSLIKRCNCLFWFCWQWSISMVHCSNIPLQETDVLST